jgi:hypothetical protein
MFKPSKVEFENLFEELFETNKDVALDVMNLARVSKYFVGTSSKISYWVICLRILNGTRTMASMPTSDEINLCPLIGQSSASQISYY